MVHRQKRDVASRLLDDFCSGRITADDLEGSFPSDKNDPALAAIYERLWYFWDSHRPESPRQNQRRPAMADDLFRRCIAFLRSDLEYEWLPWSSNRLSFGLGLLRVLGFREKARQISKTWLSQSGQEEADSGPWPFKNENDLETYVR